MNNKNFLAFPGRLYFSQFRLLQVPISIVYNGQCISISAYQSGQTKRAQNGRLVCNALYLHLPLEVRVHCTRTYPQVDQSAARNLETTNHSPHLGWVRVQCTLTSRFVFVLFAPTVIGELDACPLTRTDIAGHLKDLKDVINETFNT